MSLAPHRDWLSFNDQQSFLRESGGARVVRAADHIAPGCLWAFRGCNDGTDCRTPQTEIRRAETSKLLSEPAVEAVRTILDRLTEQLLNG